MNRHSHKYKFLFMSHRDEGGVPDQAEVGRPAGLGEEGHDSAPLDNYPTQVEQALIEGDDFTERYE